MINNEFHLIGYAVSDFVKGGTDKFVYYWFKLELDCYGKKIGKYRTALVNVPSTNKTIDIYQQIRGKQLIVEGYIDFYVKEGNPQMKCVATNISVLGDDNRTDFIQEQQEQMQVQEQDDVQEEDLPF